MSTLSSAQQLLCSSSDLACLYCDVVHGFILDEFIYMILVSFCFILKSSTCIESLSVVSLNLQRPNVTLSLGQPWLIRTDPDLQCRCATARSLVDKVKYHVLTCRFFHDGVGPWQSALLHSQNMPRTQFRPQWATNQPGP